MTGWEPIRALQGKPGPRLDLPVRRPVQEIPSSVRSNDFGIVVMSHRGASNGRLSVLLSSIPAEVRVVVSSDSIEQADLDAEVETCRHHGADFKHCTPWAGRAANAINCMKVQDWSVVMFVCDDVWLFPEFVPDVLRWWRIMTTIDVPLGCMKVPGWETVNNFSLWGFESWQDCLDRPWLFEAAPPNPAYTPCPALAGNPFGACMVINHKAYDDVGGFSPKFWAHDDGLNHLLWTSGRWVCAAYPGRGYMHYGAQGWHEGETVEFMGSMQDAFGVTPEESARLQQRYFERWRKELAPAFAAIGGSE